MSLGQVGGYDLPYFSKSNLLTKSDIIKQFTGDKELGMYIPDNCNPTTVTRSFLLSLLFNIKREKYLFLYNAYKKKKLEQSTFSGKVYEIDVENIFANEINNYVTAYK